MEKATNQFVESSGTETKESKKVLEEELAVAKGVLYRGKRDKINIDKLSERMATARLVLKVHGKKGEAERPLDDQSVGQLNMAGIEKSLVLSVNESQSRLGERSACD